MFRVERAVLDWKHLVEYKKHGSTNYLFAFTRVFIWY